MNNYLRGTGRTTRMLEHAKRLEAEGKTVCVVMAGHGGVNLTKKLLGKSSKIFVFSATGCDFRWDTMRPWGAGTNTVVLVDHYAIEQHFADVLEMLHRYDAPREPVVYQYDSNPGDLGTIKRMIEESRGSQSVQLLPIDGTPDKSGVH